jgi:hypothetical protein
MAGRLSLAVAVVGILVIAYLLWFGVGGAAIHSSPAPYP